jgi:formylglycine-generating enzyme required for sulfatase activity
MGTTLEEERVKGGGETGVGEGDKLPMYCMSWYDCQDFIAKLNAITGLKFRLPTEAEWEFAARGGNKSRGFLYSGSDNADEVAWHSNLTNGQVKEVGTLKANELGIYDMSGNVWEWVLDGYQKYSLEESYNPVIPVKGQGVLRGGSTSKDWGIRYLRVSERKEHPLTAKRTRSGFRIVLDKE